MLTVNPRRWDDREWEHRLFPLLLAALTVAVGATLVGSQVPAARVLPPRHPSAPSSASVVAYQAPTAPAEPMIQVQVADIVPSDGEADSVVLLMDAASQHVVPLFIAASDGEALQAALRAGSDAKAEAQSLARQSIAALGGAMTRVELGGDDHPSVSQVVLQRGDSEVAVGAKLGDALELAIAAGLPVYIPTRLVTQGISRQDVKERPDGFPSRLRSPERM